MSSFIEAATSTNKGKIIKFANIGDEFVGIISAPVTKRQATDFTTKAPKFFPKSGDPIYEEWISLDDVTAASKEEAASTLIIDSQFKRAAVGKALIEAGVNDVAVGGTLALKWTGYGVGKTPSNPPKSWEARYQPPAAPSAGSWGGAE